MILVAGATGELGGLITRGLLARREEVRILVRSGSAYEPIVQAGAHPVAGDLKDPASLAVACQGADVVVTTANAVRHGGAETSQSVDLEGNLALISAARSAGVKQFIFVSADVASEECSVPLLQAKAQAEIALEQSGLPYTILAPDIFMQSWVTRVILQPALAGRPVTLLGAAEDCHAFVAVADVGAVAVAAVAIRRRSVGGCSSAARSGFPGVRWSGW